MATSSLMDMRGINCAIPIDNWWVRERWKLELPTCSCVVCTHRILSILRCLMV
jgi:hypothetical protein